MVSLKENLTPGLCVALNRLLQLKKGIKMTLDLSLVQTSDLLEEIVRRHDAVVLTGIKYTKQNGEYVTFRRFSGNRFTCNGLIGVVSAMIAKEEINHTIAMDSSEDR